MPSGTDQPAANRDPADRRLVRVGATAKGRAVLEAGRRRRIAALEARLAALSAEERESLAAAAELMLRLAR